jgi:F0F1-type ATP synthase assembly protein I
MEQTHSRLAVVSFAIGSVLITLVAGILAWFFLGSASQYGPSADFVINFFLIGPMFLIPLGLVGFVLGVIGIFRKGKKKAFAALGAVLSALVFLIGLGLWVFALLAMCNMHS